MAISLQGMFERLLKGNEILSHSMFPSKRCFFQTHQALEIAVAGVQLASIVDYKLLQNANL